MRLALLGSYLRLSKLDQLTERLQSSFEFVQNVRRFDGQCDYSVNKMFASNSILLLRINQCSSAPL